MNLLVDGLQKFDKETVDVAMRVTLGEDLEDMREDSNATKEDVQKLRVELKPELGAVKKHLKILVDQWDEIQVLAEGTSFLRVPNGTPASTTTTATPGNALDEEIRRNTAEPEEEIRRQLEGEIVLYCIVFAARTGP